jgi:predicted metalloprotease with PDZ domain
MLLEVVPGSSAARAGLKSGDVILQANGGAINHYQDLQELLKNSRLPLQLEIERSNRLINLTWRPSKGHNSGVVPVPEPNTSAYLVWQEDRYFLMVRRIWQRLKALI